MRRIIFLLLTLISCISSFAEDPGYYFTNYDVSMVVNEDGSYDIKEHIDAYFTESSRGLFRMIPIWPWIKRDVSEKQDGSKTNMMHYKVSVENFDVSEKWAKLDDTQSNMFGVRIGSENAWISGPHSYTISFKLHPYDDRVPQGDLLFYSLLGTGWDCRVERFSFKIHFNKPLSKEELSKVQLFVGEEGSHDDYASTVIRNATATDIAGTITSTLGPKNAVSIFIPLHEGYFTPGNHPKWDIIATWIFIGLSVLLLLWIYTKEFAQNKSYTKIISFYPPKDCSSADVGVLFDASTDDRDIISLIPWFAQKGYLTIENTEREGTILHKKKDLPSNSPLYQRELFDGFFKNGETFSPSKDSKTTNIGRAFINSKDFLESKFSDKLIKKDSTTLGIICVAAIMVSLANYFTYNSADSWVIGAVSTVCYVTVAIIQYLFRGKNNASFWDIFKYTFWDIFVFGIMGIVIYEAFWNEKDSCFISRNVILALNIGMAIACIFTSQLGSMSEYRRQRMGEIMGLQEFIMTADKQQLERLQAEDEAYFYDILPYAVAFGLASSWADKFKDIAVNPANWYKDYRQNLSLKDLVNNSTSNHISQGIMSSVKNVKHQEEARRIAEASSHSSSGSSYSSSSSHSFGGGGFSGGGFGGGGGGRW